MNVSDKRRAPRHKGVTPIEFLDGKGFTRDFSSSGIFFETDRSFTEGQPINFTILLENVDPGKPVRVKCRGEIVRVEKDERTIGVAVAIRSYRFKKNRDPEKKGTPSGNRSPE